MHDKEILQPVKRHPATVVTDPNFASFTVEPHVNGRICSSIYILQPIGYIFPNYELVCFEERSILKQISTDMALNEDGLR